MPTWATDARDSACGGANGGDNVEGASSARGGASEGACSCSEEEKADWRVANVGARDSACGGANDGCSGQGVRDARDRASRDAHVSCDEGRVDQRVVARGSGGARGGASGYAGTHDMLTGGDGCSLKGGEGCNQGGRSDAGGS
jgi:hypothetical protein